MKPLTWIESAGGPLLALRPDCLPLWEGIDPPSEGRRVEASFRWENASAPATDYDRACDVEGYAGVIQVGPARAP